MANELDELNGPVNKQGRDINVIDKQLEILLPLKARYNSNSLLALIVEANVIACSLKAPYKLWNSLSLSGSEPLRSFFLIRIESNFFDIVWFLTTSDA